MIESRRMDIVFQLGKISCRKCFKIRILYKQILRDYIYARVRALSTEYRGDQELPGIFIIQPAFFLNRVMLIEEL